MDKPCVIYGIYHKEILGYVGLTKNLERRKHRHLNPVWRQPRLVDKWLDSVNKKVEFRILQEIPTYKGAEAIESQWRKRLNPVVMV